MSRRTRASTHRNLRAERSGPTNEGSRHTLLINTPAPRGHASVKGGVKTYRRGGVTVDHPVTRWSPSVQPVLRRRYDFGGRPSEPEDESRRRSLLCLSR